MDAVMVPPEKLKALVEDKANPVHKTRVYVVPFETKHLVRWQDDYDKPVNSKDYYEHPNKFVPVFHQKYLPYLSLLINDIYWEPKFPRYITNTQMRVGGS